ncbi:uncharacterized protein [Neodiprion pinetum]|uniref:uncharacterized protein n=1 Tax=Neodiprion pinetum TaxID=441929 RepID=UPI003712480E
MENAGWLDVQETKKLIETDGNFDVVISLSMILGLTEDYRKIIVNAKHEPIRTRSKSDSTVIVQNQDEDFIIVIDQVEYFRSWELYEYPSLLATTKHVWTVKTSTYLQKPRVVMLGFQMNRTRKAGKNASHRDHCNINDVKLSLNSEYYRYGDLNLDMSHNRFALLYEVYANLQATYHDKESEPLLTKSEFLQHDPLIFIDCSKQNKALKSGPVDIRIEFKTKNKFPIGASAY